MASERRSGAGHSQDRRHTPALLKALVHGADGRALLRQPRGDVRAFGMRKPAGLSIVLLKRKIAPRKSWRACGDGHPGRFHDP